MSLSKTPLLHLDVQGFPATWKMKPRLEGVIKIFFQKKILSVKNMHTLVLSVTGVDIQEMTKINRETRGKAEATDILSFEETKSEMPLGVRFLGDLVLCLPVLRSQAKAERHAVTTELDILLVHGLLHLCGHDHEKSAVARKKMQVLEQEILKRLKVRSGLIQRSRL